MARTWAEIEALVPTEAEQKLIEACKAGKPCVLGKRRPDAPDPARVIRVEILRYLILGGCDECRVHEWGVQLVGAWIDGELDLSFAVVGAIGLRKCRFAHPVTALSARFHFLNLNGSLLPSLNVQGVEVKGGVFLKTGFKAEGEVSLSGAWIGVQLGCTGGSFFNADGHALNAQGVEVKGSVFLDDGFKSKGVVSLGSGPIDFGVGA